MLNTAENGNVETSTSSAILFSWLHPVFKDGEFLFQRYSQESVIFDGVSYQYRSWVTPIAMGRTAEATNRPTYLVVGREDVRGDASFPLPELMRGFDGLTGTVLRALEIETHSDAVIRSTFYQVRASGLKDGNAVFELQCAGFDPGWAIIPAISHSYQMR